MYYVYTLRCADDTLYTGFTTDVPRRMRQHLGLLKGGAKYTARHKPVALVMLWQTETRSAAARLEYAVKHLERSEKLRLIRSPALLSSLCPQLDAEAYRSIPGMPCFLHDLTEKTVHP